MMELWKSVNSLCMCTVHIHKAQEKIEGKWQVMMMIEEEDGMGISVKVYSKGDQIPHTQYKLAFTQESIKT